MRCSLCENEKLVEMDEKVRDCWFCLRCLRNESGSRLGMEIQIGPQIPQGSGSFWGSVCVGEPRSHCRTKYRTKADVDPGQTDGGDGAKVLIDGKIPRK